MAQGKERPEGEAPGRLEKAAGKQLGLRDWDRPRIFADAAAAAVDNDLSYWLVLALSGAIAALGLAMGSSAVVIGAMLVAPLLAPVLGLSLSLAVGDSRLALQVGAVVVGSTAVVIAMAALLTLVLPFQSVTPEIASRTRPTTLDLAVAVFSGLVGALVTVNRGSRLSAAIPGVAVAVALIPPLAAAGFGMGSGWRTDIIMGSMLLYGANLGGIVLSGVAVFLAIGMHRGDVVDAARTWHREAALNGVALTVCRLPWVQRLGVFGSASGRAMLVLAFAAALAIPLTESLQQVAREYRVRRAVSAAEELFQRPGRTSVLGSTLTFGDRETRARVRIATAEWVDEGRRTEFERQASGGAGEPVRLLLEQLPATAGTMEDLAGIIPARNASAPDAAEPLPELLERARGLLGRSLLDLPFPAGAQPAGVRLAVPPAGVASVEVAYLASEPLEAQGEEILTRAFRDAVGDPDLRVHYRHLSQEPLAFDPATATAVADSLAALLRSYPGARSRDPGRGVVGFRGGGVDARAAQGAGPDRRPPRRAARSRRRYPAPTTRAGLSGRVVPTPSPPRSGLPRRRGRPMMTNARFHPIVLRPPDEAPVHRQRWPREPGRA